MTLEELFYNWIGTYLQHSTVLFQKGEEFSKNIPITKLDGLASVKKEVVYLLAVKKDDQEQYTFVYVGITTETVVTRWKSHLIEFSKQDKKSYRAWKDLLFADEKAKHDTYLFAIEQASIEFSPLHKIPKPSISSVEKELINILDLLNPTMLLNYEAKQRDTYATGKIRVISEVPIITTMKTKQEIIAWLKGLPNCSFTPLFAENEDGTIKTWSKPYTNQKKNETTNNTIISRHPDMEQAIVKIVNDGFTRDDWRGLFYIMGRGATLDDFEILYIGKAEAQGVQNDISANLQDVKQGQKKNKFARWGDALAYHIGDLSQAVFGNAGYKDASPKYLRWANALFQSTEPLKLKGATYLYVAPWYDDSVSFSGLPCTLAGIEYALIAISAKHANNPQDLLNEDGK